MTSNNFDPSGDNQAVRVRRARVESVDLYEIKDNELEAFEKGSPGDLELNFAIFLFSLAFSSICTLASASQFRFEKAETIFILVAIVGALLGSYLIFSWWKTRGSIKNMCQKIRDRMMSDSKGQPKFDAKPASPLVEDDDLGPSV